jgi:hypothetical protein
MCLHIQSETMHSYRILDPYLTVNSITSGDNMEQLSVARNLNAPGGLKNSLQVLRAH